MSIALIAQFWFYCISKFSGNILKHPYNLYINIIYRSNYVWQTTVTTTRICQIFPGFYIYILNIFYTFTYNLVLTRLRMMHSCHCHVSLTTLYGFVRAWVLFCLKFCFVYLLQSRRTTISPTGYCEEKAFFLLRMASSTL